MLDAATIAIVSGPISVVLLAALQGWIASRKAQRDADIRQEEKADDYARQDLVAERVATAAYKTEEAARLLVKAQAETIARTDEVARKAEESDKRTTDKLDLIHILVNSDMTAARIAERDSAKLLLIALKRIGVHDEDDHKEIIRVEDRITELDKIIADRLAAQLKIDAS
jgi:hypothetical protein